MVFPCLAAVVGEGFREPVGRADEGRFGVEVVGALLLAGGEG